MILTPPFWNRFGSHLSIVPQIVLVTFQSLPNMFFKLFFVSDNTRVIFVKLIYLNSHLLHLIFELFHLIRLNSNISFLFDFFFKLFIVSQQQFLILLDFVFEIFQFFYPLLQSLVPFNIVLLNFGNARVLLFLKLLIDIYGVVLLAHHRFKLLFAAEWGLKILLSVEAFLEVIESFGFVIVFIVFRQVWKILIEIWIWHFGEI